MLTLHTADHAAPTAPSIGHPLPPPGPTESPSPASPMPSRSTTEPDDSAGQMP